MGALPYAFGVPDALESSLLSTDLAGIVLRNPVILAAGTAGYLDETADVLDLSRIGAVITKSITARPRPGNKTWRIIETRAGMLNAVGLANMGHEVFERELGPRVARVPTTVIGSISGFSVEDYVAVAAAMERIEAVPAVELNMSCPNVSGGMEFCSTPEMAGLLLREVRPVLQRCRLFVKLSPRTYDIVGVAGACIDAGVDALTIANTYPAMAIDVETRRPRLSRTTGGLSGPAIHPIALKLVHEVHQGVAMQAGVPIIGVGGVMRWEDAAEFILAGASAVQMGTAIFADPRSPQRVAQGLARWVRRQGCASLRELVGAMETDR
ncbi:MAG: dihydroorotate dehydrogenase [Phycisphaerales bacterium]|nr:MAG: dihydroorotate dehydrogenase [Phycisphaerales bacterium]